MPVLTAQMGLLITALYGLCIGSFLNVCIARLPDGQSVVRPRSRCPRCGAGIRWFDNIPVLSFIFLRARCRSCRNRISWRYPLVELLTCGFSVLVWQVFHQPLAWGVWFVLFIAPLIIITFIDFDLQIIPDELSLSGIPIGLAARALLAYAAGESLQHALVDSGLGIVIGAGFLFLVGFAYEKIRGFEGLGGGDVKLAAMLGAFLGAKGILFTLLMSALLGSVVGIIAIVILRKGMRYAIPYGPFLAGAAVIYLFLGPQIVNWYIGNFIQG